MSEIQDEAYEERCRENEYLKFRNSEERQTIDELAKLLLRAADALEMEHSGRTGLPDKNARGCSICNLIYELRKVAE